MESLGRYVISVIAAAMVLGILKGFLNEKSGASSLLQLMGGLFLAFTLLSPAADFDFSGLSGFMNAFSVDAEQAAAYGENLARDELETIIKNRVEAYILDKATAFQAELSVEVTLDDTQVPESVWLQGDISPYGKRQLQKMMEEDLGIAKENQRWIS